MHFIILQTKSNSLFIKFIVVFKRLFCSLWNFLANEHEKCGKKPKNLCFLVDIARSYPCTFSGAMTYLHDESQNINSIQNFQIKWLCQYFHVPGWKLHYAYIHYFVFFFSTSSSLLLFHTHTLLSLARLTTRVLIVGMILFLLAVVGFVVGKY